MRMFPANGRLCLEVACCNSVFPPPPPPSVMCRHPRAPGLLHHAASFYETHWFLNTGGKKSWAENWFASLLVPIPPMHPQSQTCGKVREIMSPPSLSGGFGHSCHYWFVNFMNLSIFSSPFFFLSLLFCSRTTYWAHVYPFSVETPAVQLFLGIYSQMCLFHCGGSFEKLG